jgi:hypothetical protein
MSSVRKKKKTEVLALSEFSAKFIAGHPVQIPSKFEVDLEKLTVHDYQTLLELARYQISGHRILKIIPTTSGISEIQEIKTMISEGLFSGALSRLRSMDQSDPEVQLETGRTLVFLGRFSEVRKILEPLAMDERLGASSRGVAYQLLGHAFLETNQLVRAEDSLVKSRELADFSENKIGALCVDFFLSKVRAIQGRFEEAKVILSDAIPALRSFSSLRSFLGYFRHMSHVHFLAKEKEALNYAFCGVLISRALKDELFECRGLLELFLISRAGGLPIDLTRQEAKIREFASASESDFSLWLNAVFNEGFPPNLSSEVFLEMKDFPQFQKSDFPDFDRVYRWILDDRKGIFLNLKDYEYREVTPQGPVSRILTLLNSSDRGLNIEEIFETIWGLRYVPAKHRNLVDVNLSRVNKLASCLKIQIVDGIVRLSTNGFILKPEDPNKIACD